MLSVDWMIAAYVLRGLGIVWYVVMIKYGTVKPKVTSWSLWAAVSLLAFIAQWKAPGDTPDQAWMMLFLAGGMGLVVIAALFKNSFEVGADKFDWGCTLLAIGAMVGLWVNNPALALGFAILAELAAGAPTIINAWQKPENEHGLTYFVFLVAAIITLLTVPRGEWTAFIVVAFPLYFVAVNLSMILLIWRKHILKVLRGRKELLVDVES